MSHLSQEQLDDFRRRLHDAKEQVMALLGQTGADQKPIEGVGQTIGRLSRMDAIQVQAMTQMSRGQLEIRLRQIDASLADLNAGRYGTCRHCKGQIAVQRLEAMPEAPFCLACQESFER